MDYSPACYLRTKKTSSETSKRHTNVIKSDELRCMVGGHLFFLNQKCAAPYVACEFDRTGAEKYHPGQTHRRHFSQFEERNGTRNGFSLLTVERVRRLFPKRNGEKLLPERRPIGGRIPYDSPCANYSALSMRKTLKRDLL